MLGGAGGLGCQGGAAAGTATEPLSLRTGSGGGAPLAWAVGVGASHPSHPGLQRWARLTPACCPHPWEWAHPDMVMGEGPPACCCRPYPQGPSLCPHPLGRHMPPHTHRTCQGPMTGHPLHLPMGHSHGQGPRNRVPLQAPPIAPTSLDAQGGRAPTHPLSGGQRPAHTEQKQPQSKTQETHTSYPGMPLHINSPPRCQETASAPKLTEQETQERNEATPEPLPVTGTDLPEGGTMQPPSADSGFEGSS